MSPRPAAPAEAGTGPNGRLAPSDPPKRATPAPPPAWARTGPILAGLLGLTLLRLLFLLVGGLDLSPDEAHYWEWSRRLDWAYYSKGPLVAWLIALETALLGSAMIAIRFGALALSVVGAWLTYRLGAEAFGDARPGALAAIGLELTPLVWAGSLLMTIDAPFLSLWLLALFWLRRALFAHQPGAWLVAGLAVGVGVLAKYTMLFVVPGLVLYLWRAPESRRWLRRPAFWAGAVVAGLVSSPVVVWNLRQGWVTARHVLSQGEGAGFSALYPAEFLASQIGVLSPVIAGLLAWALWVGIREGLVRGREPYRFLVAWAVPLLAFYGALSLQGKVQANWPAAAYPSLGLAAAGLWVEGRARAGTAGRRAHDRWLISAAVVALVVVLLGHVTDHLAIPPRLDPATRLRGWAELGSEAGRLRAAMPRPEQTMLLSDQYQITSELAFYVPGSPPAYNLALGRRRNQYDLWESPSVRMGWDAVYVEEGVRPLDERVRAAFDRVDESVVLEVHRAGRVVRTFSLHRGYGFRGLIDEAPPTKY